MSTEASAQHREGTVPNLRLDGSRWDQLALVREADDATRSEVMRAGVAPAFEDLAGWEWAGNNTGPLPGLAGVRKFMKGFYLGPPRAHGPAGLAQPDPDRPLQGYNIPVKQNGLEAPHLPKPSAEAPKRFGFYRVYRVESGQPFDRYPNALMLDYGLGGNPALDPSRVLRDYLVQVYPDDSTLLLGHAFAAVPGKPALNFFVLRRERQHDFRG